MSKRKEEILHQDRYGVARELRTTSIVAGGLQGERSSVSGGSKIHSFRDMKHKNNPAKGYESPGVSEPKGVRVIYKE